MAFKNTHGRKTREQQKSVLNKDVDTGGGDQDIADLALQHDKTETIVQPEQAYDISSGDRSITRGKNDRGDHHQKRNE